MSAVDRWGSCGGSCDCFAPGARWRRRGARWWRQGQNNKATHPSSRASSRATSRATSSAARRKPTRPCVRRRRELVEQRRALREIEHAGLQSARARPNDGRGDGRTAREAHVRLELTFESVFFERVADRACVLRAVQPPRLHVEHEEWRPRKLVHELLQRAELNAGSAEQ